MADGNARIDAGGVSWLLAAAGPSDGTPVLLLHGFPEDRRSWRAQLPALARAGFRAHAADLPGIGGSSEPGSYRMDDVADAVTALSSALGRTHVVGHDWGAILAAASTAGHPEAFRSVTLSGGPHPAAVRVAFRTPAQLLRSWYVVAFQVPGAEYAVAAARGALTRLLFPAEIPLRTAREARRALAYYRANFNPLAAGRRRGGRIGIPALIVHGAADRYVTTKLMRASAEQCDDLRAMEIVPSGHFVHQEHADRFNAVLLRFLSSVNGGDAAR